MTTTSPANTPFDMLQNWLIEAEKAEINDPTAAALATTDDTGVPNVRMVLVRGFDNGRFTFFTNYNSQKGRELLATQKAALCFHWKSIRRQIRVQGNVTTSSLEVADNYYHSRARQSQIGAWASLQSESLDKRTTLLERYKMYEEKFKNMDVIPRPEHWSGFHIIPYKIEFWSEIEFRLHERLVFEKNGDTWSQKLLYP